MKAIYEPRGAAGEYAPLAVNLYSGCSHGCTYCYAPGCLRMSAERFGKPQPRVGIIEALDRDSKRLAGGGGGPVLLCFTCDPYQELEREHRLTRRALEILLGDGWVVRILTKNPEMALELDGHLIWAYPAGVEFGTTILFTDEAKRQVWEPGAPTIASRIRALARARDMELHTWVSLEPVIDPEEALKVIDRFDHLVDVWKVGRWNHDRRANSIDWPGFTRRALDLLLQQGACYYIKDELWRSAGSAVDGYEKTNIGYPQITQISQIKSGGDHART